MPKLVIREGEDVRDVFLNDGDTLGRVAQNAIVLKVAETSRTHCKFTHEKNSWFVEDQGSSNGTLVNGRKVTKFELQDGDEIKIGNATLRFLDAEEPAATTAPSTAWGEDDLSLEEHHFLVLGGAGRTGDIVMLPEGSVTVGRNARHHVILKDASVSGDHAEVLRAGGTCTVKDQGSSNGTFVNGQRTTEAVLLKGDVVRFGSIEATYGIGDTKDFQAPAGGGEAESAFTRAMEVSGLEQDASFELATTLPKSEKIWNLVSLAVLLLLGGAVAWLMTRASQSSGSGTRALERGTNLVAEHAWSFEPFPEVLEDSASWVRGDEVNTASGGETAEFARSGRQSWRWSRSDAQAPLCFAALSELVTLSPDTPYRVRFAVSGTGALGVLGLVWMAREEAEQGRAELGRTWLNQKPKDAASWTEFEATVWPPAGADALRLLVGALGDGEVSIDDVLVATGTPPSGSCVDTPPFRACLDPTGTLRLLRYGRTVIDGIGIAAAGQDDRLLMQSALWIPAGGGTGSKLEATLLHGLGDLRASLVAEEGRFRYRLEGSGLAKAGRVVIPLVPRTGVDLEVTALNGETGRRFTTDFAEVPATALIVGSGDDRARIEFGVGGAPSPRVTCAFEVKTGRLTLTLDQAEGLDLSFRLAFEKEEEAATALLREATTASREGRSGEAMRVLDDLRARFPFATRIIADAARLDAEVQEVARVRLLTLKKRAEDAGFFRTLTRDHTLIQDLDAERRRYEGTAYGTQFAELSTQSESQLKAALAPGLSAEAQRRLLRAKSYRASGKEMLATLLAASIVTGFPTTDAAKDAQGFLDGTKTETGESR